MPVPNSLLQLVPNRAEAGLRRVREHVWSGRTAVPVSATESTADHRSLDVARVSALKPVEPGNPWGRLYDQRWCRIDLPRLTGEWYLEWRDQGEATLWVGEVPYYGFDVAHRYVALPAEARELWVESYCCQSAIWHPEATGLSAQGSVFGGAYLVQRNPEAWEAAQDMQSMFDLLLHLRAQQTPRPPVALERFGQQPPVDQATPLYRRLLRLIDQALDALDVGGLPAMGDRLVDAMAELRDAKPLIKAALTGHAHIDLVWLWPERMGEAKAVHTFATANRLMSIYPEYRFAYSQPTSYRAVARRAPQLSNAVAERIASGQWQATGALEVESDTLMPCGEALARSFLMGQDGFRELNGAPSRLLWLPDVFGYAGCLPQLMRLAGVEWFFTTKLTWSAINRFPYSSFVWRGSDGSEVVAHVTQNVGYNNRLDLGELAANACGHAQSDIHPEFLHPTGYGDGGGGPTEEMCERARRLNRLAGTPELTWDHPEAFFERLATRRAALPVYQGECYLEYHRGTFTSHGDLKHAFRSLERALQIREAVAVVTGTEPDLTTAWRRLIFAQFHDYIPGSSVADVYAEGVPELVRLATNQIEASHQALAEEPDDAWQAFNPLPQPWSGWGRQSGSRDPVWLQLPPLGSAALAGNALPPPAVVATDFTLQNGRVRAEIDATGGLRRLVVDGRVLALAGSAAVPVLYPDRPSNYDAWDIDRHSLALGEPLSSPVQIKLEVARADRAVIAVSRAMGKASTLTLRYILEAGAAVLRIEADVDWHEQHTLLKLHFPTNYRGLNARFGAPFGSVLRGQQPGPSMVEAQWEVPGSRWAAVANDGEREGLAVVTEAKYGFCARDSELTVSLLRSARITGCDDNRHAAPRELSRLKLDSPYMDQGRHLIRLAVGAYDSCGALSAHPAALADTLFTEPLVYQGAPRASGLLGIEGAPTLIPAWAKPSGETAWVLRLHEVSGQAGEARLGLASGWTAWRCGLDGAALPGVCSSPLVTFRPYEIVSVRIGRE